MTDQLLNAAVDLLVAAVDPLLDLGRKDQGSYQRRINAMVAALWRDDIDQVEFLSGMSAVIRRNISEAWLAGAKRCGIGAGELSPQEEVALQAFINQQISFVPGFAGSVISGNREEGELLRSHQARAGMWGNAWNEAKNQSQTIACGNQKLRWIWNPFKEHCSDCTALNGQVRRATFWQERGIMPQSRALECRGFNCGCRFAVSELPTSRGPLPATTF